MYYLFAVITRFKNLLLQNKYRVLYREISLYKGQIVQTNHLRERKSVRL